MEILEAKAEHLEEIYKLMCELEPYQFDKNQFEQIYLSNLQNKNIHYIVAKREDKIVGFISVHIQCLLHHASNIAEIQELVVSNQHQRTGLGHKLFEKAKDIARENDCLQLEVCCNMSRSESHIFYEVQGFKRSHYKFTLPIE